MFGIRTCMFFCKSFCRNRRTIKIEGVQGVRGSKNLDNGCLSYEKADPEIKKINTDRISGIPVSFHLM